MARLDDKPCKWCKEPFTPNHHRTLYCGKVCRKASTEHMKGLRDKNSVIVAHRLCGICNRAFLPGNALQRYCKEECSLEAKRSNDRKANKKYRARQRAAVEAMRELEEAGQREPEETEEPGELAVNEQHDDAESPTHYDSSDAQRWLSTDVPGQPPMAPAIQMAPASSTAGIDALLEQTQQQLKLAEDTAQIFYSNTPQYPTLRYYLMQAAAALMKARADLISMPMGGNDG